jgi:hypothetical protein
MNVKQLKHIGQSLARLAHEYSGGPKREMLIDPALYAWLLATEGKATRQYPVTVPSPGRIDFRIGGSNPVVLEFAVRPPDGGPELYGSQNRDELFKLSRIPQGKAKLRALLLVDLRSDQIRMDKLKSSYDEVHPGPGRFPRNVVQVIYTHRKEAYSFRWSPFKSVV